MSGPDVRFRTYLRSFLTDWFTRMCGPLSVPFAAIAIWATARSAKILWTVLAAASFMLAAYRVWRQERKTAYDRVQAVTAESEQRWAEQDAVTVALRQEIAELQRKPYEEELGRFGALLLTRMTEPGKLALRYLLRNEPIEVGRHFMNEVPPDVQAEQLAIAFQMRIVQHHQVWLGNGHLLRTDWGINPQYRPVLEDLLYPR
jgi:hypothetical protein